MSPYMLISSILFYFYVWIVFKLLYFAGLLLT
jgi:hypothetical protein